MIQAIATLRSTARDLVIEQVSAAARKSHERNYEKLHVRRDGTVSWFESISKSDDLVDDEAGTRSISAIPSVITVGTGSYGCNCDFCDHVFDKGNEDSRAERARDRAAEGDEERAEAEARREYERESYATEAEAIAEAVASSDLEYIEGEMLDGFDSIAIGYFDDEEEAATREL
jgi:hypothetical protein